MSNPELAKNKERLLLESVFADKGLVNVEKESYSGIEFISPKRWEVIKKTLQKCEEIFEKSLITDSQRKILPKEIETQIKRFVLTFNELTELYNTFSSRLWGPSWNYLRNFPFKDSFKERYSPFFVYEMDQFVYKNYKEHFGWGEEEMTLFCGTLPVDNRCYDPFEEETVDVGSSLFGYEFKLSENKFYYILTPTLQTSGNNEVFNYLRAPGEIPRELMAAQETILIRPAILKRLPLITKNASHYQYWRLIHKGEIYVESELLYTEDMARKYF